MPNCPTLPAYGDTSERAGYHFAVATVHGTLSQSLDDAAAATRQKAAQHGYLLSEGDSNPPVLLVFKKGVSAFSWGSELKVNLKSESPSSTALTISTGESFAIYDWGRGARAAHRLLDAVGAVH